MSIVCWFVIDNQAPNTLETSRATIHGTRYIATVALVQIVDSYRFRSSEKLYTNSYQTSTVYVTDSQPLSLDEVESIATKIPTRHARVRVCGEEAKHAGSSGTGSLSGQCHLPP